MHVPYCTKSSDEWPHVTQCVRFKITLGNTLVKQATFLFWPIFFEADSLSSRDDDCCLLDSLIMKFDNEL